LVGCDAVRKRRIGRGVYLCTGFAQRQNNKQRVADTRYKWQDLVKLTIGKVGGKMEDYRLEGEEKIHWKKIMLDL
jgi:hypothetical protein